MNCYSAITGMFPVIFNSEPTSRSVTCHRKHELLRHLETILSFKTASINIFIRIKLEKLVPKMTRQSCLSSCNFPLVLVNLFVGELFLGRQCPTYQQVRSCKVVAKCLTADISGRDLSELRQCFTSCDIFFFFFFHFSFESQKRIE